MTRWLAVALCMTAWPLAAQQDSLRLDSLNAEAVRLATEGRGDSARAIVQRRLRSLSTFDPAYAEALFTAGLVADSADTAVRRFRQVSIEYATSQWADRALLRLAQWAFASGDLRAVSRSAERVLLEYPFSGVRAEAAFWAGRADLDLGDPVSGCRWLAQARDEAGTNIEIANRAGFYLQRCTEVLGVAVAVAVDTAVADTTGAAEPDEPSGRVTFAVQVVAVSSAAAADLTMRDLRAAGHNARVFRDDDGLLKVRVGRFTDRDQAIELAAVLRGLLGGSPFVVEERP